MTLVAALLVALGTSPAAPPGVATPPAPGYAGHTRASLDVATLRGHLLPKVAATR